MGDTRVREEQPAVETPTFDEGSNSENCDTPSDTSDRAGEGRDGQASPFNIPKLFGDGLKKVASDVGSVLPSGFPGLEIFGGGDKSAPPEKSNPAATPEGAANIGREHAQEQLDKYFATQDTKGPRPKIDPERPTGETREDGSSYKVNDKGQITDFTSAPTKDHPDGRTYHAKYDAKGELTQLKEDGGLTFTRVSPENDKGMAYWQATNEKGERVPYGSTPEANGKFVGKVSVDQDSVDIFVGYDKQHPQFNSLKNAGTMVERAADGTVSRTVVMRSQNGQVTGLNSEVTLADGQQINTKATIKGRNAELDSTTQVLHDEGDTRSTVKDGEVVKREEKLLATERMMEQIAALDGNKRLQNMKSLDVTTTASGVKVDAQSYQAAFNTSVPPNTWVNGTRIDGTTTHRNLKLDASFQNGELRLDNIEGMTGHGAKWGPLGRRIWSGTSDVQSTVFSQNGIYSQSDREPTSIHRSMLNADMQKFTSPEALEKVGSMLGMFRENADKIDVDRIGPKSWQVGIDTSDKFKASLKESAGDKLQVEDKVQAKVSYDQSGFNISDIKGVKFLHSDLTGIKVTPGKDGQYQFELSLRPQGSKESVPLVLTEEQIMSRLQGAVKKR